LSQLYLIISTTTTHFSPPINTGYYYISQIPELSNPFDPSPRIIQPYTFLQFQPRLSINSILSSSIKSNQPTTSFSNIFQHQDSRVLLYPLSLYVFNKPNSKSNTMATVATKTATPVMPPSFSMSQDISRAMTASNQKTEKTRSILIDGMPPAPPPSPVAFSKGKACYNNIPSLSLE